MKIRMHGIDLADFNQQPRFLPKLAPGRLPDILVIFHIPAWDAPGPLIHPSRTPGQHNAIILQDDYGNPNHRILPENKLTRRAHQAFTPVQLLAPKGGPTARTILIRPWYGRPVLLYCPLIDLFRTPHSAPHVHEAGGFLYHSLLVFPLDESTKDSARGVA
jgi:hypothetical protein